MAVKNPSVSSQRRRSPPLILGLSLLSCSRTDGMVAVDPAYLKERRVYAKVQVTVT